MTDADLRELERRWRETGSVEDEAAWLVERVRVGDLAEGRLGVAAHCWHAAAMEALASLGLQLRQPTQEVRRGPHSGWRFPLRIWAATLEELDVEALARAPLRPAREALDLAQLPPELERLAEEALQWVEEWVLAGCSQDAAGDEFRMRLGRASVMRQPETEFDDDGVAVLTSAETRRFNACNAIKDICTFSSAGGWRLAAESIISAQWALDPRTLAVELPKEFRSAVALTSAELTPWALGHSDPVRERVEARQRAEAASE